ncbi:tRNA 2-selenouridine(34) synthase MnmH [Anoxybacter fermentans]|nr:tRNA 2-selenouridine(34) synthase MnmH [Anoxybacter fermentans]
MKDIKVEEALKLKNPIFIDVRSPGEFAEGTIPGAVNIPLFSDEERAEIGTIYKNIGPKKAREQGLEYVSPKLPDLVKTIEKAAADGIPIIFCWRGGERSKSIGTILDLMKLPVYRLEGGYKAYRRYILDQFANYHFPPQAVVLHGYTGVGKTEILHRLAEIGHPVLDLEGLAGHRGSVFGSIGIKNVRNQKHFDALLYNRLEELKDESYILMEAESKRIGRVHMPDFLVEKKKNGIPILITASLEVRVERIIEEYVTEKINKEFLDLCYSSLKAIEKRLIKRIGKAGFVELEEALFKGDLKFVVRVLLTEYYDPLYKYSQDKYDQFVLVVDADDLQKAVNEIDKFLKEKYPKKRS